MNSKTKVGTIFIIIALIILLIALYFVPMATGYDPIPGARQTAVAQFGLYVTYLLSLISIIFIIVSIVLIIKGSKELESYGE